MKAGRSSYIQSRGVVGLVFLKVCRIRDLEQLQVRVFVYIHITMWQPQAVVQIPWPNLKFSVTIVGHPIHLLTIYFI